MTTLEEFYDRTSSRFWNPLDGLIGRDLQIFPLIPNISGGSVLEYGFGSASLLFNVAKKLDYEKVVGIDLSEAVIDRARKNLEHVSEEWCEKFQFGMSTNDHLPDVASESIDTVISVATIEHVIDPYIVLDELHRITKPDGYLICSVPNYAYLKYRIQLLFGQLPITGTDKPVKDWREAGWDGMHIHTFTRDAFDTLLRDCGWLPQHWTGWGTKIPALLNARKRYPQLLSGELIALCKKTKHPHS
jgi:SAM-dependent methyltransferase